MTRTFWSVGILVVLLGVTAPAAAGPAGTPAPRTAIRLDDNWTFEGPSVDGSRVREVVRLPHTWNATDAMRGLVYARGVGTYTRVLPAEVLPPGRRVFLRFEGANTVADVAVNGTSVGHHRGGYTAFVFEITPLIVAGSPNTITVRVDNSPQPDVMPLGGDFNIYGGLHRPVWLITTDRVCVSPLDYASSGVSVRQGQVTPEAAALDVAAVLTNGGTLAVPASVTMAVLDAAGAVVADATRQVPVGPGGGATRMSQPLTIPKPRLWKGRDDPYLYRVRVAVTVDGRVVDEVVQPFGVRTLRFDPKAGFFLNGAPLKLKGVSRHQDWQGQGSALTDANHETDIALMTEMGVNAVRLAHYPHSDGFLDLCDRAGVLAWVEIPFVDSFMGGYADTEAFRANGRQQLIEMIRQGVNHPSIAMWGLYNELTEKGATKDAQLAFVRELQQLAKREDPTRPTTAASMLGPGNPLTTVPDTIAFNRYYGWYNGQPADLGPFLDDAARTLPSQPIGVSEYGAGGDPWQHEQRPRRPFPMFHPWHPEEYQAVVHEANWAAIDGRPFVWGSFVWNMFDFGVAMRREGGVNGINNKGLVTYDRRLRKDTFFFYKAAWSAEPVLYIASRRHVVREDARTDITVYANVSELELRVNGERQPTPSAAGPVYRFTGVTLRTGNNVIEATGRRGTAPVADSVVWVYDGRPYLAWIALVLRWLIKPLYLLSGVLVVFSFVRGVRGAVPGRARTLWRVVFGVSLVWFVALVALWGFLRTLGASVFDYSML